MLRSYPKIKFLLVGSGPERDKLLNLTKDLNLSNVKFLEVVPKEEMPRIVSSCSVAIIPLKKLDLFKGAIPSKIFENLAMQKPIILGVEGEAKELFIDEGKCGLSFFPEDEKDLAAKVLLLFEAPEVCEELGKNAREYVSLHFNRDVLADKFVEQLKHVR